MWGSLFHAEKGLFPLLKKRRVPGRKNTEQQQDIYSTSGGTSGRRWKEKKGDIPAASLWAGLELLLKSGVRQELQNAGQ